MTLRVQFIGPLCQPTGYGRAFHDYLSCLIPRNDLEFKVVPIAPATHVGMEKRYQAILGRQGGYRTPPDVAVVHAIPMRAHELVSGEHSVPPGVARVCITTWESDTFPKDAAKRLADHFDAVIVPSTFNRNVMGTASPELFAKLHVVPHAFDPEFWGRPEAGVIGSDRFKDDTRYAFYTIGSWVERKNPIGLLKAYLTGFSSKDDVVLRFLTPAVNESDVTALGRALNLTDLPPVEFYGREGKGKGPSFGRFNEEELLALHYRSKCYVSLTRGEGWNLGAFEAAIVGNTVIATEFGGQLDFLQGYSGFCGVDKQMTPAVVPETMAGHELVLGGIKVAPMSRAAPPGLNGHQNWAEPDLLHARDWMRAAYRDRANFVRHHDKMGAFTYEIVGEQLAKIFKEVKRGP